jgi:hypothetical protein
MFSWHTPGRNNNSNLSPKKGKTKKKKLASASGPILGHAHSNQGIALDLETLLNGPRGPTELAHGLSRVELGLERRPGLLKVRRREKINKLWCEKFRIQYAWAGEVGIPNETQAPIHPPKGTVLVFTCPS